VTFFISLVKLIVLLMIIIITIMPRSFSLCVFFFFWHVIQDFKLLRSFTIKHGCTGEMYFSILSSISHDFLFATLLLCYCFPFLCVLVYFSNVKGTGDVYNRLRLMSIQIKDGLLVYHFITPFESLYPNKL
jgi:membrane protein insertase Oxa1/YidC/SpoIIIJ